MDRPTMKPVSHGCVQPEAVHDASSGPSFGEPLSDLGHPSSFRCCGVDVEVSEDVVVLRITWLKYSLQSGGCLLGACDESGLVGVELETSFSESRMQAYVGLQSFLSHIERKGPLGS